MRDGRKFIPDSVKRILNKAIAADKTEQIELIRLSRLGDKRALDKLTFANVKFIVSRALSFAENWDLSEYDYEESFSTIVSAGIEGMYKAIQKYDEEKGCFLTYAKWYIDKFIRKALQEECERVSIGNMTTVSLDDEMDDEGTDILSFVADDGPSVEEIIVERETISEVKRAVAELDNRSRDIFVGKIIEGKSHKEFCEKYNICDERVRQILKEAKESIRYSIAC